MAALDMKSAEALEIAAAAASAAIDAIHQRIREKDKHHQKCDAIEIDAKPSNADDAARCRDDGEASRPLSYTEIIALGYQEMKAKAESDPKATSPRLRTKQRNETWEERYADLVKFKTTFGHCDVLVSEESGLGNWVRSQRAAYRDMEVGKSTRLAPERERKLTDIGFRWRLRRRPAKTVPWQEQFDALVTFKSKFGHFNVYLSKEGEHRDLKKWIFLQRSHYRRKKKGEKHSLPDEFEEKLRGIGFDFNDDSGARGNRLTWSERYAELLDYKEKNGNCDIASSGTNNEHHALHVWVLAQRFHWRRKQRGESNSLSDEKEEKLRGIGFDFGTLEGGRKRRKVVAASAGAKKGPASSAATKVQSALPVDLHDDSSVDLNDYFE
eukprot:CAMPEP_0197720220 /NCGR_PEP_ID=MMETSP1434-20131217/3651_1 /TAXON_ID=265543 /ORGANISM="Minutocellus polymorphus, Strain CCMP3303" /LENGTH=381 /DNA_ID=CAMNT_0043305049 /DNA_START=45 /DNA_END=1190 /DNA_ORIENTATION=-